MEPNYFVCTLGEAAQDSWSHPYKHVCHLIQHQATHNPDLPAIGSFKVSACTKDTRLEAKVLTFEDVKNGVVATADLLSKNIQSKPGETIGLLSASSPTLLFTWLGCIWMGHPVLLVAPECSAPGIARLCYDCGVSTLIVDERHEQLGQEATKQHLDGRDTGLTIAKHPFWEQDIWSVINSNPTQINPVEPPETSSTAYYHHTSGTSSGLPKPIPQSHHGAVGVLPALDGKHHASFTTTPLYHGGPADTFRAWSSHAMIWLFPRQDLPITSSNIIHCLKSAQSVRECPPITYFGAVPYILDMMCKDDESISWLQKMDLVSVGGAALGQALGNRLVEQGVNLVSRFGSAECGFLLSSHRDYANDKDWQYLRLPEDTKSLRLESREDGLSELVVLSTWPYMAKRNREEGSYATADLFEKHPHIPNAWKYHSRADAQLTLATALKFDPASLEGPIVAGASLVSEALVFGNGQPYPGVLLFRSKAARDVPDADFIDHCAPVVDKCCTDSLSHARIQRSMMIPMPFDEQPLLKSSKGTILRSKAEDGYRGSINAAYDSDDVTSKTSCSDADVFDIVSSWVAQHLSTEDRVDPDQDLFSLGVNSIASIQIRKELQRLLPRAANELPINVVEDCGTVNGLVDRVLDIRNGRERDQDVNNHDLMRRMVCEHSKFRSRQLASAVNDHCQDTPDVVVLTGSTGTLGAHVLDLLMKDSSVSKIYCLIRGASPNAARERVSKSLLQKQLQSLKNNVEIIEARLSDRQLGLTDQVYDQIAQQATIILHLAWSVNFRMQLASFKKDVAGVENLINLALSCQHHPRFLFCSSTASATAYRGDLVPETTIDDPTSASQLGYSQSKWVAEHICQNASMDGQLRGRVFFARVGQLSGNSQTGVWNMKEAWPLMLSTVKLVGCLPDLPDEFLDWLPVDTAAAAITEASKISTLAGKGIQVFHVLNNKSDSPWGDLLMWLRKRVHFEVVSPLQWLGKLEAKLADSSDHPALGLLDHWKRAFTSEKMESATFETERTTRSLTSLQNVHIVDEQYVETLWEWIDGQT